MKKALIVFFIITVFISGKQIAQSACPYQTDSSYCELCPSTCPSDYYCKNPCCEKWLDCSSVEDYFCRIGLNECQKVFARNAIEKFKCDTICLRAKNCKCETKGECRNYKKSLRRLDCKIKNILTKCQKSDYNIVRKEIRNEVNCCHRCLINPFYRCKCGCK